MFAECLTLGKAIFAECLAVLSVLHSVNKLFTERRTLPSAALGKVCFAECPIKSTRQSHRHSAKTRIPVVIIGDWESNKCSTHKKLLLTGVVTLFWSILLCRNDVVFNHKPIPSIIQAIFRGHTHGLDVGDYCRHNNKSSSRVSLWRWWSWSSSRVTGGGSMQELKRLSAHVLFYSIS
jgi:hypothetical protein